MFSSFVHSVSCSFIHSIGCFGSFLLLHVISISRTIFAFVDATHDLALSSHSLCHFIFIAMALFRIFRPGAAGHYTWNAVAMNIDDGNDPCCTRKTWRKPRVEILATCATWSMLLVHRSQQRKALQHHWMSQPGHERYCLMSLCRPTNSFFCVYTYLDKFKYIYIYLYIYSYMCYPYNYIFFSYVFFSYLLKYIYIHIYGICIYINIFCLYKYIYI